VVNRHIVTRAQQRERCRAACRCLHEGKTTEETTMYIGLGGILILILILWLLGVI
jgi:hypothetical protein